MTDTVIAEGQVKFRDGKKVNFFHDLDASSFKMISIQLRGGGLFLFTYFLNVSTVEDSLGRASEALPGRR